MSKDDNLSNGQKATDKVQLAGGRSPLPRAQRVGPVNPEEEITVTVLLHRPPIEALLAKTETPSLKKKNYLSREKFAATYGAKQEDIKKVEQFARTRKLSVSEVNAAAGTVQLKGTAASLNQAFGVELEKYKHPDFTYRGHRGPVMIPSELDGVVEAVFGLDNRPQVRTHFQIFQQGKYSVRSEQKGTSYTPPQVAQLYRFPSDIDCSKQCIGIIELGGGYTDAELQQYFSSLGITEPSVKSVSVNGGSNQPTGDPGGADGEVVLDIEVAAAVAPGVNIVVYFAPNTDAGFLNAINTAIHDTGNKPSVVSISWGAAESEWTQQAMAAMDRAAQDAAAVGVTICCAAGDRGSADGVGDGLVHVDFPASSPHMLACGGTRLEGSGATITNETVWDDGPDSSTGGGVSDSFKLPAWQNSANVPSSANPGGKSGRGVPDVAGNADPGTGYQILVDGQQTVIGGTSAVAPLWSGLIALINQQLGHAIGFIQPVLYNASARSALRDITQGNNDSSRIKGAYAAGPGWDACTGLGSPVGSQLSGVFQNQ
ncbi:MULTISPECIES: S53 family peptidase [unclassified Sporolactobacillus]|uniref:S53 family peptidase n=1 Tax=unclassified Sporolactobacillus TaxID=2628533 RepID=UPI00236807D6|nr:S53 family peptidase [Sporolactobacillus sp. CQH2019]MDD9146991.1 S53 family peptidase [Sporolactobacillus sp. CQH2019]